MAGDVIDNLSEAYLDLFAREELSSEESAEK